MFLKVFVGLIKVQAGFPVWFLKKKKKKNLLRVYFLIIEGTLLKSVPPADIGMQFCVKFI